MLAVGQHINTKDNMPKKIPPPNCIVHLAWKPTGLRIDHSGTAWWLRARQSTALGDTWVAIACTDTADQALAIALAMANGKNQHSDGWSTSMGANQ